MCDTTTCGYPTPQVTCLYDSQATRDKILDALDALSGQVTPNDTVLIFYSGHGIYSSDGTYYLMTHDSHTCNHQVLNDTGISTPALFTKLRTIQAKHLLLVFNACHAVNLTPTLNPMASVMRHPVPSQVRAALLSMGEGRLTITACRAHQFSC